jgi:multiple sugar transport system substrate-binding protein
MKKLFALIIVAFLVLTVFVGCTSTGTTTKTAATTKAKEDVTLDFWYWEESEGQEKNIYTDKWVAYAKSKGINVNFNGMASISVMHEKLIPALAAKVGPDVLGTTPAWIPELVSLDALKDMTNDMKKWESFANNDVGKGILELCRANQKGYYCMPWNVVVLYLYCRVDLFEAAGVAYPETMDQFYQACKDLTRDTNNDGKIDQYGFAMRGAAGGHTSWASLVFNADANASYLTADGKPGFNTQAVIDANQKFIDLYKNGYCPPSSITDGMQGIQQNFTTGVAAMFPHHIGSYNTIIKTVGEANVKVIAMPVGASGNRFITSDPATISINAASKHLEEAVTFMEFLVSPDIVVERAKSLGRYPWQESLLKDAYWHSNQALDVSTSLVGQSVAPPVIASASDWTNNLFPQTLQRALQGMITSKEMIQILADGLK